MCWPDCRCLRRSAQSTSSCPFSTHTDSQRHRWVILCGLFISKPGADFRFCICHTAGLVSGLTLSLLANSYSYWAVLIPALPLHTLSVLILHRRISAVCLSTLPLSIPGRAAHTYFFPQATAEFCVLFIAALFVWWTTGSCNFMNCTNVDANGREPSAQNTLPDAPAGVFLHMSPVLLKVSAWPFIGGFGTRLAHTSTVLSL